MLRSLLGSKEEQLMKKLSFLKKKNFISQVETRPWFKVSPRLWMICVALVEYEVRNRHLGVIHLIRSENLKFSTLPTRMKMSKAAYMVWIA